MNLGDFDEAVALLKEQERVCRETDNIDFLLESLEVQAKILVSSGDPDGAMARLTEMEQICRERGDPDGVARSRNLQAKILRESGEKSA